MRVLLISHSSRLYGAQRSLVDLAIGLHGLGIDPVVTLPEPGPMEELVASLGFTADRLPCRNWVYSRGTFQWVRKFLLAKQQSRLAGSLAQRHGVAVIHTNTFVTPVGAMAAKRIGLPHIWHVREHMPPKPRNFYLSFERVKRFVEETTQFAIGNSIHTCKGMEVICPKERIRLIYNGPISEDSSARPMPIRTALGSTIKLLCVGRSTPAKGHDIAAAAMWELRRSGIDATLTIAGDTGLLQHEALSQIAPEGLEFAGFVDDTDQLYDSHDILLMASLREAFGRVTVEAMAHGCLVVGADAGGTAEIVKDGETGLLCIPGDAHDMAEKVRRIASDREMADRMRLQAHDDVFRRFTRERYAREVAELYRIVVDSG